MSSAAQQQWSPIRENIEDNSTRIRDEEYNARAGEELDIDGAKSAMGGIGAVSYEQGREIAARARAAEMAEEGVGEGKEVVDVVPMGEYNALFQKFFTYGNINAQQLNTLQQANISSDNYAEVINGLDIVSNIKSEIMLSLNHLNDPERIIKAQGEILEEFPNMFESHIVSKGGETIWESSFHEEAFTKLSQHYMGGETKTVEERNQDMNIALTMACEDLGLRAQLNLNASNTEYFNKNMRLARNNQGGNDASFAVRFQALTNISRLINHTEGVKGKGEQTRRQLRAAGERKLTEIGRLHEIRLQITDIIRERRQGDIKQANILMEQARLNLLESGLTSGEATALLGGEDDILGDAIGENMGESP